VATFWNANEAPARILAIFSPGGFEQFFRDIAALDGEPTPDAMVEVASRYGIEADVQRTIPLVERHGLML
jgi:hypothetical protein